MGKMFIVCMKDIKRRQGGHDENLLHGSEDKLKKKSLSPASL